MLRTIQETNSNNSMSKSSLIPPDFQQALDFAIMYRLYKEDQNINWSSHKPSSSNNPKQNKSQKKSALFQKPIKSKINKSLQSSSRQYSKQLPKFLQQPVEQQYCFNREIKNQPQNDNIKPLNHFISQLSTPTELYAKEEQSYIYQNPSRSFQKEYNKQQPEYRNNFDWNSISLGKSKKSQNHYNQSQQPMRQDKIRLQNYQTQRNNRNNNQIIETRNQVNKFNNYPSQIKHRSRQYPLEETPTQFRYQKKQLKQYLPSYNQQRSNYLSTQATYSDIRQSQPLPQFGKERIRLINFTKNGNTIKQLPETDLHLMYESTHRQFYQPSPTKSVTPQKNTSQKKQKYSFKKSSQQQSSSSLQQIQQNPNPSPANKNPSKAPRQKFQSKKHLISSKSIQTQTIVPNYSKKQSSQSSQEQRQSIKTFQKHKNSNNKNQQYPIPRLQPPKPSSQITQKITHPKIQINKRDQKICKFSSDKQFDSQQSYFDSEFKRQLKQVSPSSTKQLNVDLRKYVPYRPESQEQSYQDHKIESPQRVKTPVKSYRK